KLSKMGIIHYIPRRKTPLISYTQSREELRFIKLPKEVYQERKQRYLDQTEAVIDYASSTNICRSRFLLNYFGQTKSDNCGICDICISRKKTGLDDTTFKKIELTVKEKLNHRMMKAEELVESLPYSREKTLKVLQWLEDHEVIGEAETGELEWL
ncbi:MAG: ATP-dependent helicase RecQ, partial [Anaerophaga sp.]|nr:ATP-dependent helicase RecQ [Anaerophaga sp.]